MGSKPRAVGLLVGCCCQKYSSGGDLIAFPDALLIPRLARPSPTSPRLIPRGRAGTCGKTSCRMASWSPPLVSTQGGYRVPAVLRSPRVGFPSPGALSWPWDAWCLQEAPPGASRPL